MEITDIVSTEFVTVDSGTTVAKVSGAFDDPAVKAVVVTTDDELDGVVTRRQLATSHHPPAGKVGSLVRHVPRVTPSEDVREVARLMIDSGSRVLPVFDGEEMTGVVTADDLLREVQSYLHVVTVADVSSGDLVAVEPETTVAQALQLLRENRITHLPVVEDERAVGVLSLYDVTDVVTRARRRSQGGDPAGFDAHGGQGTSGGYGAREGERERVLDLPVRDVMTSPVRTASPKQTLNVAVGEMFEAGVSSLIVVTADDTPTGIVTKTDVLDVLTWETEGNRAVQVYGADLLDDVSYDEVVAMVDRFDDRSADTSVLDAKVHLHEHQESRRGTPLLLARIRLYTDRGLFVASGEGYGAGHALREARDALERQLRDDRTYGRSKKHPGEAFWERRFGWLFDGP